MNVICPKIESLLQLGMIEKRGYGNTKQLSEEFSDFFVYHLSRFEWSYPSRNNFTLNRNVPV